MLKNDIFYDIILNNIYDRAWNMDKTILDFLNGQSAKLNDIERLLKLLVTNDILLELDDAVKEADKQHIKMSHNKKIRDSIIQYGYEIGRPEMINGVKLLNITIPPKGIRSVFNMLKIKEIIHSIDNELQPFFHCIALAETQKERLMHEKICFSVIGKETHIYKP